MQAYRRLLVIKNPRRVTLSNLPFRSGQRVEVLFLAQDENRTATTQELIKLFKETQALPQVQPLSEEDIAAEVAAYRAGR